MADLPDSYDLIVVGTGMPECIVAAAAARIGKSVLHLDRNQYYGELWASFNFEYLSQWIEKQKELPKEPVDRLLEASWLEQLNDGEHLILCPKQVAVAHDILQKSSLEEEIVPEDSTNAPEDITNAPEDSTNAPITNAPEEQADIPENQQQQINVPENEQQQNNIPGSEPQVDSVGDVNAAVISDVSSNSLSTERDDSQIIDSLSSQPEANSGSGPDCDSSPAVINESEPQPSVVVSAASDVSGGSENQDNQSSDAQNTLASDASVSSSTEQGETQASGSSTPAPSETISSTEATKPPIRRWTTQDFSRNRHKFNIDLSPKLLFSRGALVELLISSNTARYADFQSVNRILTLIEGRLDQVPCSRADVFSTKNVTVVEKRMLMKLLTFCLEYQKHPEEYRGYEGRPFIEFLRSRKITPNIEHYILHAIAMVDESCLTLQGLQATQKFMESLGRFGNSPFLWTCYGSAELPQCFCRLCAVFGGIYYLGRDVDAIILDSNNHCAGILSQGQKLKCSSLVMGYNYLPLQYRLEDAPQRLSRAIYITDGSILPAERQQNTFLRLPPVAGVRNAISILEFGSLSFICPKDLYVVHMTCKPFGETVEEDFLSAEEELFMSSENDDDSSPRKPRVLWSLHFRHFDVTMWDINSKVPDGVFATSPPGTELDFEHAVHEARHIFQRMFPEEEFLPRAPDPEDIIVEDHSNPGNEEQSNVVPEEGNGDAVPDGGSGDVVPDEGSGDVVHKVTTDKDDEEHREVKVDESGDPADCSKSNDPQPTDAEVNSS